MLPVNRRRILKYAAMPSMACLTPESYASNRPQPSWHGINLDKEDRLRLVIANMEAQELTLPKIRSENLTANQPMANFVISQTDHEFPQSIVDAHKRGVCTAVFRNDALAAQLAIQDLMRTFTSDFHRSTDHNDLQWIVETSTSTSLPVVIAGSGTAQGNSASLRALEIALAKVELSKSSTLDKVRGIFVAIFCSKRVMKMSAFNEIINQVRDRCCDNNTHFAFGADYDESIGDGWRVSVLVAV